jgi:hypothetical protein
MFIDANRTNGACAPSGVPCLATILTGIVLRLCAGHDAPNGAGDLCAAAIHKHGTPLEAGHFDPSCSNKNA